MDEKALRSLITDVKDGRLSRRGFVQKMVALGLTGPMAAQMLDLFGCPGRSRQREVRVQADQARRRRRAEGAVVAGHRRCSIRISPSAPRTRTARASSTSRWPAGIRTAICSRSSPPRSRARENGGLAADGKSVTWKLKRGVKWHDGKPFTADDVVFNWEYAKDPATAAVTIGSYKDVKVEKVDDFTVKRHRSPKPTPFWADAFVGTRGMLIPKHLFADYSGAKSRDAPTNLKPVGTGPYKFVDFKPGDMVRGEINPNYHLAEPALFRLDRDEGRRRRGLGGARGAADRRVRLRLEPAGRGRDPAAVGEGRQGQGR